MCIKRLLWQYVIEFESAFLVDVLVPIWRLKAMIWKWKPHFFSKRQVYAQAISVKKLNIDGLVQDSSISTAHALEMLQSCTKPSILPSDLHESVVYTIIKNIDQTIKFRLNSTKFFLNQIMSADWYVRQSRPNPSLPLNSLAPWVISI